MRPSRRPSPPSRTTRAPARTTRPTYPQGADGTERSSRDQADDGPIRCLIDCEHAQAVAVVIDARAANHQSVVGTDIRRLPRTRAHRSFFLRARSGDRDPRLGQGMSHLVRVIVVRQASGTIGALGPGRRCRPRRPRWSPPTGEFPSKGQRCAIARNRRAAIDADLARLVFAHLARVHFAWPFVCCRRKGRTTIPFISRARVFPRRPRLTQQMLTSCGAVWRALAPSGAFVAKL